MKLTLSIALIVLSSCQHYDLNKFNRQLKSLDKYIERNERREFKKEQRQLKREFKGQRK